MFEMRRQDELLQLLNAGAGFSIDAGQRQQHELVQLATAAANGGGYLTLAGLGLRQLDDLVQIAVAGKGHISFED